MSGGDFSFTEDVSQAVECPAGAIFLSWRLAGSDGGGRGVCRRGRCPMPCVRAYPPEKSHAIRLDEVSIKSEKRCNSNDQNSKLEAVAGELHAKLGVGLGMREVRAGSRNNAPSHTSATRSHWCGGRRRDRGPGCGARGRWRGLAGLRDDAPSEARGADGERAGRRPRAHKAARTDEKCPPSHHRSQLHSNTPKSHMRNMRAS